MASQVVKKQKIESDITVRLPKEILISIFDFLTIPEIFKAALVCKKWEQLTREPMLWGLKKVKYGDEIYKLTNVNLRNKIARQIHVESMEDLIKVVFKFFQHVKQRKKIAYLKAELFNDPQFYFEIGLLNGKAPEEDSKSKMLSLKIKKLNITVFKKFLSKEKSTFYFSKDNYLVFDINNKCPNFYYINYNLPSDVAISMHDIESISTECDKWLLAMNGNSMVQ